MSPERWRQVEELYYAGLAQESGQRSAFLTRASGGDEDLRREVESLLAQGQSGTDLLEGPAWEWAEDLSGKSGEAQFASGAEFGPYRLEARLGMGGMGVVYKAKDTKLGRTVAVKFIAAPMLPDEEMKRRFVREAQAAARLDHPNICTVYGLEEASGLLFLVMAYLEGENLHDRLRRGPLSVGQAIEITVQAAHGLHEAHEQAIVHRDIKPANIFLTRKGLVKITDFGLALLVDRSRITKAGSRLGTEGYMSPEQFLGETVDRRSDIWSLGVVLYEMLCGCQPFRSSGVQSAMPMILKVQPRSPSKVRKGCPAELDRIVCKALSKDPRERYQHLDDMIVDLRTVLEALPFEDRQAAVISPLPPTAPRVEAPTETVLTPHMVPERHSPARRRAGSLAVLAFAVLFLAGVLIAWWRFTQN